MMKTMALLLIGKNMMSSLLKNEQFQTFVHRVFKFIIYLIGLLALLYLFIKDNGDSRNLIFILTCGFVSFFFALYKKINQIDEKLDYLEHVIIRSKQKENNEE